MFCWCNYLKHLQAQDFLSKAANENKAIEFRLEDQSTKDICNWFSNIFFYVLFWLFYNMSNKSSLLFVFCWAQHHFLHQHVHVEDGFVSNYLRWFLKRPPAMELLIQLRFQCMTWLSRWRRRATWISRSVATLSPAQWQFSVELKLTGVVWVLFFFNKHQQIGPFPLMLAGSLWNIRAIPCTSRTQFKSPRQRAPT